MDKLINSLNNNGFKVECFSNSKEMKRRLLEKISLEDTVGIGGSMTIDNSGIYEDLTKRGNKVYWHWKAEDKKSALEKAKNSNIYLASTNAITEDGKLVNIDGVGNRVAAMIYGHREVYIVVGKNKICKDYNSAIDRIKNIAAPKNAIRLNLDTPCRHTGICNDCNSPNRMCNIEVVLHKNPSNASINIFLVDEELGY